LLQIEKQSLCWATTKPIFQVPTSARWDVDAIELLSKYGLTRQLENWQKVGGSRSGGGFPSSQLSAAFAGAKYARAYVQRATRLLGDGFA